MSNLLPVPINRVFNSLVNNSKAFFVDQDLVEEVYLCKICHTFLTGTLGFPNLRTSDRIKQMINDLEHNSKERQFLHALYKQGATPFGDFVNKDDSKIGDFLSQFARSNYWKVDSKHNFTFSPYNYVFSLEDTYNFTKWTQEFLDKSLAIAQEEIDSVIFSLAEDELEGMKDGGECYNHWSARGYEHFLNYIKLAVEKGRNVEKFGPILEKLPLEFGTIPEKRPIQERRRPIY